VKKEFKKFVLLSSHRRELVKRTDFDNVSPSSIAIQSFIRLYTFWKEKGKVYNKRRATIMCSKNTVHVNDTIVVIHIFEELKRGRYYSVSGPKEVCSEFINDSLTTCSGDSSTIAFWSCNCGDKTVSVINDVSIKGPGIIFDFDNTKYVFQKPGTYNIQWKMGKYISNVLTITVE
jgi:hypothetical protein